mmetsp:Transcript_39188/g.63155  ORF Transcript_39188/g.63155 Transcript_39188/m.63155 type:complete len:272 (-) Transcript_39188:88-903(-)
MEECQETDTAELRAALESRSQPLQENDWEFCSIYTLKRYMVARKGDTQKALAMLLATLKWRDEFGVDKLRPELVRPNGETGKVFVCGPDLSGQPVLLLRPGRENSKNDHNGNLKHLVYQLERAVRCMDEESGVGKMTVILDLHNYSTSNAPPMRTSRATLDILQNHYPERLSKFVIVHAPWLFYAFFKVISPFIDKVTASKVVFIKDNAKKTMEANVNLTRIPPSILCPTKPTAATDDAFFFEPHIYFSHEGEQEQKRLMQGLMQQVHLQQ